MILLLSSMAMNSNSREANEEKDSKVREKVRNFALIGQRITATICTFMTVIYNLECKVSARIEKATDSTLFPYYKSIHNDIVIHVKLLNSQNDGNTVNQHQCQVIKDPEKNSGSS